MNEKDPRLAYELVVGRRVSDNHWYLTKKLLQQNNLAGLKRKSSAKKSIMLVKPPFHVEV